MRISVDGTDLIKTTVITNGVEDKVSDGNNVDKGELTFTTGTIKCAECGGKGICNKESGECECFKQYTGSKGWNKDKNEIEIGDRGDCSHYYDTVYPIS